MFRLVIARGVVRERVSRVVGPVRRREVFEVWLDDSGQTWRTPRFRHLTVRGEPGERTLCKLPPMGEREVVVRRPV